MRRPFHLKGLQDLLHCRLLQIRYVLFCTKHISIRNLNLAQQRWVGSYLHCLITSKELYKACKLHFIFTIGNIGRNQMITEVSISPCKLPQARAIEHYSIWLCSTYIEESLYAVHVQNLSCATTVAVICNPHRNPSQLSRQWRSPTVLYRDRTAHSEPKKSES
jgi:hypothetical protein